MIDSLKTKLIELKLSSKPILAEPELENNNDTALNKVADLLSQDIDIFIFNTEAITPKYAIEIGQKIKQLCAEFNTMFFLKGKVDVAYILNPDCILLDSNNLSIHHTKEILGEDILIGYIGNYPNTIPELPDFIIDGHAINSKTPVFKMIQTNKNLKTLIK